MNNKKFKLIVKITTKQGKEFQFHHDFDNSEEAIRKRFYYRFSIQGTPESPTYDERFLIDRRFMVDKSDISSVDFLISEDGVISSW